MKRYCKGVDIWDRKFVRDAVENYFFHKSSTDIAKRGDIQRLFREQGDDFWKIADYLIAEHNSGNLNLPPVRVSHRIDPSSNKERILAIENIKQQLYDQIAADALKPATAMIGEYQCTCLKNQEKRIYHKDGTVTVKMVGRGQDFAVDTVQKWWSEPGIRKCVKMDIYHNYASVPHSDMSAFLERHIANADAIDLTETLIETTPMECREEPDTGLPIGSVLSITLDALYLSQAYHHLEEDFCKIRRTRAGPKRIQIIKHLLMWMDDIYIFTSSEKDANTAAKETIRYCATLGLKIKPNYQIISKPDPIDCVGFKVYPDKVELRRKNYLKAKKALKRGRKNADLHTSQEIISHNGELKTADSYRFRKKYHAKSLMKKARKVVSEHDKSIIQRKAAGSADNTRRPDNRTNCHERQKCHAGD